MHILPLVACYITLSQTGHRQPCAASACRGVIWHGRVNRWRAAIKHNGKKIFLGNFTDESEAGKAFDKAALKLRGLNAKTNFPLETYGDIADLLAQGYEDIPAGRALGRPRKRLDGDDQDGVVEDAPGMPLLKKSKGEGL